MILSGQSIRRLCEPIKHELDPETNGWHTRAVPQDPMITPFCERTVHNGKSFGLSYAGYDIRVKKFLKCGKEHDSMLMMPGDFILASSVERIKMPNNLLAIVHDKSSWARDGLSVQNTVLEPGWEGYITLELNFQRPTHKIILREGDPIAQLVFHVLDEPAERLYQGKYQNQEDKPVEAIHEEKPVSREMYTTGYGE